MAVIVYALLSIGPCVAQGQDLPSVSDLQLPCAPEVQEPRRLVLDQQGHHGVWLRLEVIQCMAERLAVLPLYAERVQLLQERLRHDDDRDDLRQRQVALAEEGERRATEALEAATRRAREADEAAAFERDLRWVWFGAGVVVTVALELLAFYGLGALRP